MTHALAAYDSARDFHSTLFTDDAAKTNAAILAAVTLVVFLGAEYALIKETILLRTLGTVVDRLRLGNLTLRPLQDSIRRSESHDDGLEVLWNHIFALGVWGLHRHKLC